MYEQGSTNHLLLHCPMTMEFCHKLFRLVNLAWILPRSVCDMLTIFLGGWGALIGAKFYGKLLSYFDLDSMRKKKCKDL